MNGAEAFDWEIAWQRYEDDIMSYQYYELPSGDRIYPDDEFWIVDEHRSLKIINVRTKIYTGVVGHAGDKGEDHVFYEYDYDNTPDPDPFVMARERGTHHHDPTLGFESATSFDERIQDGALQGHAKNGAPSPPP